MSQKRQKIDKQLKARVTLEALRGEKTIALLASEYEIQPSQVNA